MSKGRREPGSALKFRAYLRPSPERSGKGVNKIYDVGSIDFHSGKVELDGLPFPVKLSEVTILRPVGLLDKNQNPIYELDIVHRRKVNSLGDVYECMAYVVFEKGCFSLSILRADSDVEWVEWPVDFFEYDDAPVVEVVGNLLTSEKLWGPKTWA